VTPLLPLLLLLATPAPPKVTLAVHGAADGDQVTLGFELTITDGWHVYWENPGDSGMPTSMQLDLPDGWTAGPVLFPGPRAFEADGLVTYGYADRVVLLSELTTKDAPRAGVVTVTGRWLVCKDVCEPESADVRVDLSALPARADVIEATRALLPAPATAEDARITRAGDTLEIRTRADAAELFPNAALDLATGSARPRFAREPTTPGEEIVKSSADLLLRVTVRTQSSGEPLQAVLRATRGGVTKDVLLELPQSDGPSD